MHHRSPLLTDPSINWSADSTNTADADAGHTHTHTQLPYFWAGAKAYDLVAATRQKSVPASHYMDACVRAWGIRGWMEQGAGILLCVCAQ